MERSVVKRVNVRSEVGVVVFSGSMRIDLQTFCSPSKLFINMKNL